MTGLSVKRLRDYDDRGLFAPAQVEPATGRRRYSADQLWRGRLLAALVGTGMPVARAARMTALGDRAGVLEHLERSRRLLATVAEHVPPPGPDQVLTVEAGPQRALPVPLVPGAGLLGQVRAARADLARRLGVPVGGLPGWGPQAGLPGGPRVQLGHGDGGALCGVRLLLAVPDDAVLDGPWAEEPRGTWAVSAPEPADRARELLAARSTAQRVVDDVLDHLGAFGVHRRLALDAPLASVSLAVSFQRW